MYARRVFEVLQSYFHFVANFNIRNKYSMICHAIGLHKDVFQCDMESLENKVYLCDPIPMEQMAMLALCLGIITVLHHSIGALAEDHKDPGQLPILHDLAFD